MGGKIYFSALVDCFDGKIVGATTSRHPHQQLADDCLKQAFDNNAPPDPATLVISFRSWLPLSGQQLDSSLIGHRLYAFDVEEGMFTRQFSVRGIVRQNEK